MKHVLLITAAASSFVLAQSSCGAFTLATSAYGDTGGQPFRTSDGSGFFVHSTADAGDGTPSLLRPLHSSSWAGAGDDLEWTSYLTHDRLGPTRRGVFPGPNNQADMFYIFEEVYPQGFTSRNANIVSLTQGHDAAARTAVTDSGVLFGGAFIAGPAIPSAVSPARIPGSFNPIARDAEGVFLARLTVKSGVSILGSAQLSGSFGTLDLVLNDGIGSNGMFLNSYRLANVTLSDPGFDTGTGESENFAGVSVDVYDIWLEEWTQVPTPGTVTILAAAGLTGLRRRRV